MPIERKPAAYLFITALIWGASLPIIKYALAFISPLDFLFYRFALATLLLIPIAFFAWKSTGEYLSVRRVTLLTLLGIFGVALELFLLYIGLSFTYASRAALLFFLTPLTTKTLFALKTRRHIHLSPLSYIGAALVIVGVVMVLIESLNTTWATRAMIGNICIILSMVVWSIYAVLTRTLFKKHTERHSPITLFTLTTIGATATLLPVIAITAPTILVHPVAFLPGAAIPSLLYLVLLSSTLGYMTFEAGSKYLPLHRVTRYLYLQPIVGALLALLWLSEPLTLQFLLEAGIIGLGAFLIERR